MELKTFFDNFDLLADAPNSVQKLREMILQLAVQGNLVPQDPKDEPASVLLEKIKRIKPIPEIGFDEVPYEVPNGWKWVRLESVAKNIHYGYTASADHNIKGVRLLRITDIQDGHVEWENVPGCEIEKGKINQYRLNPGDMLIARTGGTIGKTFLIEGVSLPAIFASYLIRVIPRAEIFPKYLKYYALSPLYWQQLYEKCSGTGQPNVNATSLKALAVPLPPTNEQKRIVAKVDELMALCGELEGGKQKAATNCIRLNDASLDGLITATEANKFSKQWQRICDSFDILYSKPENVVKLRQTILQLAVQGKLVPQDPKDEPASVLMEKIAAEKERLVKEGKIRKSKALPAIKDDEMPYKLPDGWEWTQLDDISIIGTGSTPLKSKIEYYMNGTIPWLTSGVTSKETIDEPEQYITKSAVSDYRLRIYGKGTLIIALYGQGKTRGQVSLLNFKSTINQACAAIAFPDSYEVLRDYTRVLLRKKYDELRSMAAGGAQPNLNVQKIKETTVPLPPLNEQKRIVAKVDELMGFCDALEGGLSKTQTDCNALMEAAVAEIMAA